MTHTHFKLVRRFALTAVGLLLVWGSVGLGAYAIGWNVHKDKAQSRLLGAEHQAITKFRQSVTSTKGQKVSVCHQAKPSVGQLIGVLEIPTLHLTAPVEEGTGTTELSVAAGHDPTSVLPGQNGASVLLAHDVSYFVHVGELKQGDSITYQTPCSTITFSVIGQLIVKAGSPIPGSSTPTLVLDTCYPSNALYFTTTRLLVFAKEIKSTQAHSKAQSKGTNAKTQPGKAPKKNWGTYSVDAPSALVAQGLALTQNEVPMGTLALSVTSTPNWDQSPGPLSLQASALEAYFGAQHAMAQQQASWWRDLIMPVRYPPVPLWGASVTGDNAPLNVGIISVKKVAKEVILSTQVQVSGGVAPGAYTQIVTISIHGKVLHISNWQIAPS